MENTAENMENLYIIRTPQDFVYIRRFDKMYVNGDLRPDLNETLVRFLLATKCTEFELYCTKTSPDNRSVAFRHRKFKGSIKLVGVEQSGVNVSIELKEDFKNDLKKEHKMPLDLAFFLINWTIDDLIKN